ncbi:MAG: hypothetical protein CMB80_28450 [Flammeovirgaceae bacterium]|nr:hypothetical protein [Flammeovirgaceae bacterium]MBR07669.1 hypothetical protein [Rickettsiales bacterium]HCX21683.1 hypothetical protein [Cytophagales bacterium]|tara:strand:- start:4810 stop:5013 length:204 start_codon:yes stop_codon:yes gene_type:complete
MGEIIATIFMDLILHVLFGIPGAFVRWIFIGRKRSFKEIWNDDLFLNAGIGGFAFALVVIIYILITR